MLYLRYISICILIIFLSVIPVFAQNKEVKEIETLMNKVHDYGIFNGNVLVVRNGKTIYQSSFGYSNGSKTSNLTPDFLFNIGSIGKEFNAVGIMMLKEQGLLRLDDKVSKYIDSLPDWADRISIKNLLQYTSGLPDINWKTIKSDTDIFIDMKQIRNLNFEPGSGYAYNNSNVFLQRRIIEKISGMSFNEFVKTNMLIPCGMNSSVVDPDLKGERVSVSFNNDFREDPRQFSYVMSGWTAVTAEDLYKWSQGLHSYRLIERSSFIEILLPVSLNKQSGLGGGRIENNQIKEHTHHGSSIDFEALMYTEPAEDDAIILLTNNMNFKLFEIKDAIRSILNGTPYKTPQKSLLTAFKPKLNNLSGEGLIVFYNELKLKQSGDYNFESESELNTIGYQLLGSKRFDDAIKIFELNVKLFPKSANAYDSLAEAFYNKGDKNAALTFYKKTLELDANNPGAKEMVAKLESVK